MKLGLALVLLAATAAAWFLLEGPAASPPNGAPHRSDLSAEDLFARAEFLRSSGRRESLREAAGSYEEASLGFVAAGDRRRGLDCLRSAAEIDRLLGDLESALRRCLRARRLAEELEQPRLQVETLNELASIEIARGEVLDGERMARRAHERAVARGWRAEEARALENLGEVEYSKGNLRQAIAVSGRAFGTWSELGDAAGQGRTLMFLGYCRSDLGEMGEALRLFEDSVAIWRSVGDARQQAIALVSIGRLKSRIGSWQQAIEHFLMARRILEPIGDREWEASIWNGLGFVYESLGRPERAVEYYREAVRGFEDAGLRNAVADNLHDAGRAAFKAGDTASALSHLERALEMSGQMEDRRLKSYVLGDLAILREASGDATAALRLYREALAMHRRDGDFRRQAFTLNRIGLLTEGPDNWEAARQLYTQALSWAVRASDRRMEALTRHNLARMERRAGRPAEALRQIQSSIRLMENLRADVADLDLRATFWGTAQESYRFLVDLLMQPGVRHPGRREEAAAFEASERLRARSMLDLLRAAGAKTGGPSAEDSPESDGRPSGPSLPVLAEALPLPLKQIQERTLGPDTVLLEYLLGEDRSFVWVVSRQSIRAVVLPPRREVEALARDYYEALTSLDGLKKRLSLAARTTRPAAASSGSDQRGAALSRALLAPVAADIRGRRLLLVADGALQYVPLAALPDPETLDGPNPLPLVVGHEIVSLPSASTLAELRREFGSRPTAPRGVAIFADPVFSPKDSRVAGAREDSAPREPAATRGDVFESTVFSRLADSRREATAIAALAPPGEVFTALDFQASRAAVLDHRLGAYRILHFATHGLIDSQRPERSAIVLSLVDENGGPVDGYVRLDDIYNLELTADLVVLSACQTALGKDVRGEGLIGLTRAFMHAGAKRVMASLWKVEDRATAELMARFYQSLLRQNLTPAAALRKAQISMLEGDRPIWRDPFFWAGFVVQGEWE